MRTVMKKISIGFVVIVTIAAFYGQSNPNFSIKKKTIELTEVNSITILKTSGPPDTIKCVWKRLTEEQIKSFVNKWNSSGGKEARKYLAAYKIVVYLKNLSKREFRANGRFIKED